MLHRPPGQERTRASSGHRIRRSVLARITGTLLLTTGLLTPAASAPAGAAQSALTIALAPQYTVNWWPPIVPGTSCETLTGGMGGGMNLYMPLLWVTRHDTVNFGRSVASSIRVTNHDTVFTITLNRKWHWSNGHPVTAADVLYDWTLLRAASQPSSPLPYCYAGTGGLPADWSSVREVNPWTVVVRTTKPVNPVWFEHNGLAQLVPIPKSVWDQHTNTTKELAWIESVSDQPMNPVYQVVDGAYRIQAVVPKQFDKFVANPAYDGHKAAIQEVVYLYEGSAAAEFAGLRTGQVDIGYLPFSLFGARDELTGYRIHGAPQFGFYFVPLNLTSQAPGIGPLFQSLYIRQALQEAIDQPLIISAIYHGYGTATYGPVPKTAAYYDSHLGNPYPYDPAKARALLEAHGWHLTNGVMTKHGHPFRFTMFLSTGSRTRTEVAEVLQGEWKRIGVEVTLQSMGLHTLLGYVSNRHEAAKWDSARPYEWLYIPDYYPTGGALYLPGGGFNVDHYSNPVMTRRIEATYLGGTPSQIRQRFDAYQAYAEEQLPGLYVPIPDALNVVSNRVKGYRQWYNVILDGPAINRLSWNGTK